LNIHGIRFGAKDRKRILIILIFFKFFGDIKLLEAVLQKKIVPAFAGTQFPQV
jgi:hypothetical protein